MIPTTPQKMVLATILAAIIGFLIVVPVYDIMSGAIQLDPLVMLGIGIIAAVVLVKAFGKIGSFVTLGMLVFTGVAIIVVGVALSSHGVSWNEVSGDADSFSATEWAYQRNCLKLANGTLAFCYVDSSDSNVTLSTSSNNGVTWTERSQVDDGDKDIDQVCAECIRQVPVDPVQDVLVVVWREEKTSDPQLFQIRYAIVSTLSWSTLWTGYVSTTALNQVDPYVAVDSDYALTVVYAEEQTPGAEDYWIFETGTTQDDVDEPNFDEGEPAFSLGEVPPETAAQRWPCLALDRENTVHMTWSGYNSIGSLWQLWYCNRTALDANFDDFTLVYNNELTTDQVKASMVCANVSASGETADGLVVSWEEGEYGGFGDVEVLAVGMWVGDDEFQAEATVCDDYGLGPSVGFHQNRLMVVWQNFSTGDIRWGYADFTGFGLDLAVRISTVAGQAGLMSYRYDPSFIWSYWGGHDKWIVVGTQAVWMMSLSDGTCVWSLNLYTAPSNPGGGGGGGGGAPPPTSEGGGDEGSDLCGVSEDSCCGSTSAVMVVSVSWFCMVGWLRRGRRACR